MSVRVRFSANDQLLSAGRPPRQAALGKLGACSRCMRASAGLAALTWLAWIVLATPAVQLLLQPLSFAVASMATLLFIAHVSRYLLLRRQRASISRAFSFDRSFAAVMSLLSERH